jgi:hypothetical protein
MLPWIMGRIGFMGMASVAFVLAHDLTFLTAYGSGYEDALTRTGHDPRWDTAVLVVLALGGVLLSAATWRLHALAAQTRAAHLPGHSEWRPGTLARHLVRLWVRLSILTTVLFVLLENFEHARMGAALPGLGVLWASANPDALPIILVVAFAVALVGALFRWRREMLLSLLSSIRPRWQRPSRAGAAAPFEWVARPAGSLLGRRLASRAPPVGTPCRVRSLTGSL